jgi:probable phosphoglycerate mutase
MYNEEKGKLMRILFTRHGESEANLQRIISNRSLPHQLTPLGIHQATVLGDHLLKNADLQMIVCSPIARAVQTAALIANQVGLPFSVNDALREFDCGAMEGRSDQDAWLAHQAVVRAWDEDQDYDRFIPPDGESFNDLQVRFVPFLKLLMTNNRHMDADILLVSHGALLHQMLPIVHNNIDRDFTKQHPLGNCQLVISVPEKDLLRCICWNDIAF